MILYIYCEKSQVGKRPAEKRTLKIDLEKTTKATLLKTLESYDFYKILAYKPKIEVKKVYANGKLVYKEYDGNILIY